MDPKCTLLVNSSLEQQLIALIVTRCSPNSANQKIPVAIAWKYIPKELMEWGRVQIHGTSDRARGQALWKPESSTRNCCFVWVCFFLFESPLPHLTTCQGHSSSCAPRPIEDITPVTELTQLGYPYQTSGSTECAQAIIASNYRGGGPQVSEHLSIQGRVEIKGLCGGVGWEQTVMWRVSWVVLIKAVICRATRKRR